MMEYMFFWRTEARSESILFHRCHTLKWTQNICTGRHPQLTSTIIGDSAIYMRRPANECIFWINLLITSKVIIKWAFQKHNPLKMLPSFFRWSLIIHLLRTIWTRLRELSANKEIRSQFCNKILYLES
jgi:hypothetical protein